MREKLIDLMTGFYGVDPGYYGVEAYPLAEHLIANDVVPVVRCKDCTFCKVDNSVYMRDVFGNENDTPQYHCLRGYGYNKPDHFCSYGERRDSE